MFTEALIAELYRSDSAPAGDWINLVSHSKEDYIAAEMNKVDLHMI